MASLESLECLDNALELAIKDLQGLSLEPANKKNQSLDSNNGSDQWADLFVNEMMKVSSLDDARFRATVFESLVNAKQKEITDKLMKENRILKRAVIIQHEHHQKADEQLKKIMSSYEEQLKDLEVKNYALSMHLRQATQQENNHIAQCFPPDVF